MGRTNKVQSSSSSLAASKRISAAKRVSHGKSPRKSVAAAPRSKVAPAIQKPRRFHPGTVALREIRRYQKTTETLLRREPFIRLVRYLAADFKDDVRFQASALGVLQLALEQELISNYEAAQHEAVHAKRITIDHRDLNTARAVRNVLRGAPVGPLAASSIIPFAPRVRSKKAAPAVRPRPTEAEAAASDPEAAAAAAVAEPAQNAIANALVQAVAQEMTVNTVADAPGSPATPPTDAPATPAASTPVRNTRKPKSVAAQAPQFDDNDMSVFG